MTKQDDALRNEFPDITDQEMRDAHSNLSASAQSIAKRTGEDVKNVTQRLQRAVQS